MSVRLRATACVLLAALGLAEFALAAGDVEDMPCDFVAHRPPGAGTLSVFNLSDLGRSQVHVDPIQRRFAVDVSFQQLVFKNINGHEGQTLTAIMQVSRLEWLLLSDTSKHHQLSLAVELPMIDLHSDIPGGSGSGPGDIGATLGFSTAEGLGTWGLALNVTADTGDKTKFLSAGRVTTEPRVSWVVPFGAGKTNWLVELNAGRRFHLAKSERDYYRLGLGLGATLGERSRIDLGAERLVTKSDGGSRSLDGTEAMIALRLSPRKWVEAVKIGYRRPLSSSHFRDDSVFVAVNIR